MNVTIQIAVCVEKHKLVVPLLFLLLINVLVSVLFIISATVASIFLNSAYDWVSMLSTTQMPSCPTFHMRIA